MCKICYTYVHVFLSEKYVCINRITCVIRKIVHRQKKKINILLFFPILVLIGFNTISGLTIGSDAIQEHSGVLYRTYHCCIRLTHILRVETSMDRIDYFLGYQL